MGSVLAERVGQGEVGGYTALLQFMVAVAAACRKALVNDGWPICLLSCTNGCRKHSLPCRDSDRRALTTECFVVCGFVQGCEPTENVSIKP